MAVAKLDPRDVVFDLDGHLNAGGKIRTVASRTDTNLATYTDETGTINNTNPIVLDSSGQCHIFGTVGLAYGFIYMTSEDVVIYTEHGITFGGGSSTTTVINGDPDTQDLEFEFLGGTPPIASETMGGKQVNRALSFPANFSGAGGRCIIAPTAAFVISVKRNDAEVGTINFAAGSKTATFSTLASAAVTVAEGDWITFHAPASEDTTIADIFWVLVADVL